MVQMTVERRKHKRHPVNEDSMVIFQKAFGLVTDISEGGIALNVMDYQGSLSDDAEITYYCKATSTTIIGLPIKFVRKEIVKFSQFGGLITQKVGIRFNNPSAIQQKQIRDHIARLSPPDTD